jgi:hypothetical protein
MDSCGIMDRVVRAGQPDSAAYVRPARGQGGESCVSL